MRLFGYYRSSASYRIRIALNLKQLPFEYVPVLLNRGEQHATPFKSRNPSGLVPVLETGSESLAQSSAIAEFLEERHPEPPLLPRDDVARARVRQVMAVIGCDVQPLQNQRVLNWLRDELGADDAAVSKWIAAWIGNGLQAVETLLAPRAADGPFAFGVRPTLADAWLVPQVYNARRFKVDLAACPRVVAVDAHCLAQEEFAAARPEAQPDAPA